MLPSDIQQYADRDPQHAGSELQALATEVGGLLPDDALTLLARTDTALMVCAVVAAGRSETAVERAPFGRIDWEPSSDALLVELDAAEGLLRTISSAWPNLRVLDVRAARVADANAFAA